MVRAATFSSCSFICCSIISFCSFLYDITCSFCSFSSSACVSWPFSASFSYASHAPTTPTDCRRFSCPASTSGAASTVTIASSTGSVV